MRSKRPATRRDAETKPAAGGADSCCAPLVPEGAAPRARRADAYHHGDLRRALLDAAHAALAAGAYEALSLRELARAAGVSANAPYRHFASKQALLAAVAARGFDELSARFDAETAADPVERLSRMSDRYTGFAADNPALYRVMFGSAKRALMGDAELARAARACFGRLVAAVVAARGGGDPDDVDTLREAVSVWSVVHGHAMLAIDGVTGFLPPAAIPPASVVTQGLTACWTRSRAPQRPQDAQPQAAQAPVIRAATERRDPGRPRARTPS